MPARVIADVKIPNIPLLRRRGASKALREEHSRFIVRALERASTVAREITPVGATALLKGTIITQTLIGQQADVVGQVIWAQPYAKFVDQGTPPHTPPIGPLLLWARRVLGDERAAYAVRAKISKVGTDAQNFAENTRTRIAPEVILLYRDAVRRYAMRLGVRT